MTVDLEDLCGSVSEAIRDAEAVDADEPASTAAHLRVSSLEEQIADNLVASDPEGAVARRGAVRAALKAGEPQRAHDLARTYIDDPEAPEALRRDLLALVGVLRTNVLTFEEFVAPFSRLLDESARSCRLRGQCPAIAYMDTSFRRLLGKLRRDHDRSSAANGLM